MRIILLDDERIALAVLEKNVKKAFPEAEVISFRKSSEFIDFAESHPFDIAFLDRCLPGITGTEIAEKLRNININAKIIFNTGDTDAVAQSGYTALPKPCSVADVLAAVQQLSCS